MTKSSKILAFELSGLAMILAGAILADCSTAKITSATCFVFGVLIIFLAAPFVEDFLNG